MATKNKPKVHFMGIGGSALSGVALMAKEEGFSVTGCDLDLESDYLEEVKKAGVKIFKGHDPAHLEGVDMLFVSPSITYLNEDHPEYIKGKKRGILKTWDEFVGDYLLLDKEVICISGTHGKSTTTGMTALLFEKAGYDPSSLVGAKVKEWNANYRIGRSNLFIIEADDFYGKFLNYNPSTILINNIEFDHPDYFKSEKEMISLYTKFVKLLGGAKNLVVNQNSPGNKKMVEMLPSRFLKSINIYGYWLGTKPLFDTKKSLRGVVVDDGENKTVFNVSGLGVKGNESYELHIPGKYNVSNSLGVIILGKIYGIDYSVIFKALSEFGGIGRRLDVIGEKNGIMVYDDYAHHPTAISATLKGLKQANPDKKILAVIEPHSFSRTKALLGNYKDAFKDADAVIITKIFPARDDSDFGVKEEDIIKVARHGKIKSIKDFNQVVKEVKRKAEKNNIVIVMGAGKSYQLARAILNKL
jgi:UDP-N-acetylmuramate--alanine ligase